MPCPSIAKARLQEILEREFQENRPILRAWYESSKRIARADKDKADLVTTLNRGYALSKGLDRIKAMGSHQVALDLRCGYLAKVLVWPSSLPEDPEELRRVKSRLTSAPDHFITAPGYDTEVVNGVGLFRQLCKEIKIPLVPHEFVGTVRKGLYAIEIIQPGAQFAIVPDISDSDAYLIREADSDVFDTLGNGAELQSRFIDAVSRFHGIYEDTFRKGVAGGSGAYRINVSRHLDPDGSPGRAFRRMFFVRISRDSNKGELFLGDIDHVHLYEPEQIQIGDR